MLWWIPDVKIQFELQAQQDHKASLTGPLFCWRRCPGTLTTIGKRCEKGFFYRSRINEAVNHISADSVLQYCSTAPISKELLLKFWTKGCQKYGTVIKSQDQLIWLHSYSLFIHRPTTMIANAMLGVALGKRIRISISFSQTYRSKLYMYLQIHERTASLWD